MSDKAVIDLSGFEVGLSDAELERAGRLGNRLVDGAWYKFGVTTGGEVTINRNSGNMQLVLPVVPLDEDDQPRKPTMRHYITLPWTTPEQALLDAGLEADLQTSGKNGGGPNTAFLVAIYLRAVYGDDEFPTQPRYNKDAGGFVFQGEVVEREDAEVISAELAKKRDDFFSDAVKDCESFTGDTFFAMVQDQEDNDFQRITLDLKAGIVLENEIPEGAVIGTF